VSKGGTIQAQLERLVAELQEEVEKWNKLGMNLEGTQHTRESFYLLKMQMQTMINILLAKNFATDDEFNLEFKTLLLKDMQRMREMHEESIREARREAIIQGAVPPLLVPKIDLDGKDFNI
jgi:hypothetical protein